MAKTNRTVILLFGTAILLFLGLIYAWSIFRAPLSEIFPAWTAVQMSATFTISLVCFCTGGFIAGKLTRVIKHKNIVRISGLLILVGFCMIWAFLSGDNPDRSLVILYVFYGVFGGLAAGLSYNALLGLAPQYYPEKTGMASGTLLLGFGVGGLVLGSIVNVLNGHIGINNTFLALAIILTAVLFGGSFFIKLPEKDLEKEKETTEETQTSNIKNYSLGEAVKQPIFWLFCLWNIFMSIGGLLVMNSAVPIAVHFGIIAILGLIVTVFNGVGRLLLGLIFDAIGRKNAIILNSVFMLVGGLILLLGATTGNPAYIYIGLPVIGISFGGTPTLFAGGLNAFFGPKNYPTILGTATYSVAIAATIGPLLSSKLQEISGGEYTTSFLMIIITSAIAITLSLTMARRTKADKE